jgi:Rrf2 family protein
MLRFNRKTDYAIRVLLALAKYPPGEIIPSGVIREKMYLPKSLSLQIISRLAHLELINSYPGRSGGIQLAHPPAEITLYDVITGMEGSISLSACLEEDHQCQLEPDCTIQAYWKRLQGTVERELKQANIQQLSKDFSLSAIEKVK